MYVSTNIFKSMFFSVVQGFIQNSKYQRLLHVFGTISYTFVTVIWKLQSLAFKSTYESDQNVAHISNQSSNPNRSDVLLTADYTGWRNSQTKRVPHDFALHSHHIVRLSMNT